MGDCRIKESGTKRKMVNITKNIWDFCRNETVFIVAVLLAVLSAVIVPPSMEYFTYLDYRVLALLFSLMLIVAGIRKQGIFSLLGEKLIQRVRSTRQLELVLVGLCFFSSMLITNDVALITFVPFTIELLVETGMSGRLIRVVVLQTIAANLGSMLTPIGNPQNLFLYSLADMSMRKFILLMLPLTAASLIIFVVMIGKSGKEEIQARVLLASEIGIHPQKLAGLVILLIICLGTVARLVPWQLSFGIVLGVGLICYRELFKEVDYCLLGTFAGFFIFVGNMQKITYLSEQLQKLLKGREFLVAVGASQIISNVPAAMLLSGFTDNYRALLFGVDVGGLGTLIASLASLISYKFYANSPNARKGRYLLLFSFYNVIFLAILLPLAVFLL